MWEFNYGEWTEAYVFLRLLGNGRIYAADRNFEQDENVYIDILNIIRYEKEHILEFQRELESVAAKDNGIVFKVLPYDELISKADYLYDAIKNVTSGNRKFNVPEIERYLSELKFSQPKVPKLPREIENEYGKKTDIIITMQDSTDLLEWLIKTYTNDGEIVLDNCMGSGSTGVACVNTGRDFIGIELNKEYYDIANERINQTYKEKYNENQTQKAAS